MWTLLGKGDEKEGGFWEMGQHKHNNSKRRQFGGDHLISI
jgi:hypothetical protein